MSKYPFDAVIFDLDGVITQTALVHSRAWKKMFDDFLLKFSGESGEPFREFSHETDYLPYVDGKPRYEGVESFLLSRNITLPFGDPSDDESRETICGLGNRKNATFNEVLKSDGISVYDSTVELIRLLKEKGIRVGVASSSKNCEAVLERAGLLSLIETRVDGVVSAEMGLKGKPEPDIFITAAQNLGASPYRSIVVEDAVSGVAAGRNGNFGLVLGIARENNHSQLYQSGADIVVSDLSDISFRDLTHWFKHDLNDDGWQLTYRTYEPGKERTREALLSTGNGYFACRGAFDEQPASKNHYPGTYVAGLYNRLTTEIAGRPIENEDFVNAPNWLPVTFKIGDGNWIDLDNCSIIEIERTLDFRTGLYERRIEIEDAEGHNTLIISQRFVSMDNRHLSAQRYSIIPLNYDATLTLRAGINGTIINEGVERYKSLNQHHLKPLEQGVDGTIRYVLSETTQSGIQISQAARFLLKGDYVAADFHFTDTVASGSVYSDTNIYLSEGSICTFEKIHALIISRPGDSVSPLEEAMKIANNAPDFDILLEKSAEKWEELWKEIDIKILGDRLSQKLVRLHLYHLMISMSPFNAGIDAGITARGLHGEAYRGHIFWDELFIQPLYNLHLPQTARAMLLYRYRRLDAAREYAKMHGYKGAMFPWQSGSDGREETQTIHLNPLNGHWDPDHSSLQRHVSLAIAWNIWNYYHITGDLQFLEDYGLEMFLEICRFWESKCHWNNARGKYDLTKVMGPDEFHEHYPGSEEGGLNNNAYTNLMAAWAFRKAKELLNLPGIKPGMLFQKLRFTQEEIEQWQHIATHLFIDVNSEGIIAQYEGYFGLKELNWEHYKQKYGNIYRMDRILKAEGLTPDAYKVSKQADFLMIYYLIDKTEVDNLLKAQNIILPDDYLQRNLEYYFKRTSHGSTLSRVVHSRLALMAGNKDLSWQLYTESLASDYNDIQGGTTAEGIHAGVMAGTILIAITSYAGIDFSGERIKIYPNLPDSWQRMDFGLTFKGKRYSFQISKETVEVICDEPSVIETSGRLMELPAGQKMRIQ